MATNVEIPTQPAGPFSERVSLNNVTYTLLFKWNVPAAVWVMDVFSQDGTTPQLIGVPLVTGCDLLEQFAYTTFGAQMILTVITIGPGESPDEVPGFFNLGVDGHLYATMP